MLYFLGVRRLKRFFIAILLILFFVPVAHAFDWSSHVNTQRFKQLNRNYDWVVYFDTQTVMFKLDEEGKAVKSVIDVWQRHYYVSERNKENIFAELKRYGRANEKDLPAYEMYHCVYNLQNRTIKPIQRIIYSENGTVLFSTNFKQEAIVIVPDTEPEIWLNGVVDYVVNNIEKVNSNTFISVLI